MKYCFTILTLVILYRSASQAQCSLPVPNNLKARQITSCSMDVSWKNVTGASYCKVRYKPASSSEWIYSEPLLSNKIFLTGLLPQTTYEISAANFCSDSTTSGYSAVLSKATLKCTVPGSLQASNIGSSSATISWIPLCDAAEFSILYRLSGAAQWTLIENITGTSYEFADLQSATSYDVKVAADCGATISKFSAFISFTTLVPQDKKNILLIVLDDARYDAFTPNGAPPWFETPAINRIAEEGVNFKLSIPTTSQCGPSRASIYTGLYPHLHGVLKNGDHLPTSFTLIQEVLRDHGYFTGFIGKYGQNFGNPVGFDWWALSDGSYVDETYRMNGNDTMIPGHLIDNYPVLAKEFLDLVPEEKPYALFYFTRVPHMPTIPRDEEAGLYTDEPIYVPDNFEFYTTNYPSFYTTQKWNADTAELQDFKLRTYQTLKGLDENVDSLFKWITDRDELDNTFILLTSDNGYMMGEHELSGKILALEESIRVPLFVRYPDWFEAGTVINDEFTTNIDIANTLLEIAGIENTYGFQGTSLREIAAGETNRKTFFYEFGGSPNIAPIRAIRTKTDIFIRSYCDEVTEEFYNLLADPDQNLNQIFEPDYQATIEERRNMLDSLREQYNDVTPVNSDCSLESERWSTLMTDEAEMFIVYPLPSSNSFTVEFIKPVQQPTVMSVTNSIGMECYRKEFSGGDFSVRINCSLWADGVYSIRVIQGADVFSHKVVVQNLH